MKQIFLFFIFLLLPIIAWAQLETNMTFDKESKILSFEFNNKCDSTLFIAQPRAHGTGSLLLFTLFDEYNNVITQRESAFVQDHVFLLKPYEKRNIIFNLSEYDSENIYKIKINCFVIYTMIEKSNKNPKPKLISDESIYDWK